MHMGSKLYDVNEKKKLKQVWIRIVQIKKKKGMNEKVKRCWLCFTKFFKLQCTVVSFS